MRTVLPLITLLISCTSILAQVPNFYENNRGQKHLAGPFPLATLEEDATYASWYRASYEKFELRDEKAKWAKGLKDAQVTIYMGTWCGDSKNYVPKFVHAWVQAGLSPNQLKFVGLYGHGQEGKYKQGPKAEEKDRMIHRVPTFIFERDGEEFARIVEEPVNDLETDIAQIALGFPSTPSYRAANYLMEYFSNSEGPDWNVDQFARGLRYHVQRSSELNTLGYVYLSADKLDVALKVFELNTKLFPHEHNVYDSYAEALATNGEKELAQAFYEKVLLLDRFNENATQQIAKLREGK
ncbi:MAG: hypothetical protein R8G66_26445 [Cytophagales bacterium]|nr:hypothetical protein [Cytophagales bacterium]